MPTYIPANPYISSFDYRVQYDLTDGNLKIDLSPAVIQDASGILVDFKVTRPDHSVVTASLAPQNINQIIALALPKVQGIYMWGQYRVTGVLTVGNIQYTLDKPPFNLCAPGAGNEMAGIISLKVDCNAGTLMATDFCGYGYRGVPPVDEQYNITRFYPPEAELLPQKNIAIVPFIVDAYVGVNTVKGLNVSTYDFGDNIFAIIRIVATATKNVRCGMDMDSIYCGMKALYDQLHACNATPTDYNNAFGEINALLWMCTAGIAGNQDVSDEIDRLEKLLGVSCTCQACAGAKVGPDWTACVCPQVNNAVAIVNMQAMTLDVSFTVPVMTNVNIQYRSYCSPLDNPAWTDLGTGSFDAGTQTIPIPIDSADTFQVKLTTQMADGSYCAPLVIVAQGNCPQVVDINVPSNTPSFTASLGWSDVAFTTANAVGFNFQKSQHVFAGDDIPADYTAAPANIVYLIIRYPNTEPQKNKWFNTSLNQGLIPDQVFEATYNDGTYYYAWTRVKPTLEASNKVIVFKN